jgi:wyosine [tRNA(Phe)-imidazoG37] synthetase (radical SAM superfamily)
VTQASEYVFGPVASRRLGRSLGIDIAPAKVCTLDCIYCEVGRTTLRTIERRPYVPMEEVLSELKTRLHQGILPDYITITGSGEPTLNSQLGQIIDRIKAFSTIPVALISNGTLLYRQDVRDEAAKADLVMPTFDAADQSTFEAIHRPHPDITIERLVEGLVAFRAQYHGPLWLEVFLIEGVNTSEGHVQRLKVMIERIRPDKVQLNTAVRPTADPDVTRPSLSQLQAIAEELGPHCEIIADYSRLSATGRTAITTQDLLTLLRRRPCTLDDLCAGLGVTRDQAALHVKALVQTQQILMEVREGLTFYKIVS